MKLIILGAGGFGRVIYELAQSSGRYESIFFLDDHAENERVIGTCADYLSYCAADTDFYPAFGNNETRLSWLDKLEAAGLGILTFVDPTAYLSPSATVERGTVVLPKAIVNTNTSVRRGCIVNCGVIIDHDCIIEEGVHLSPGTIVKAENRIPALLKVESGTVIQNRSYPLEEQTS